MQDEFLSWGRMHPRQNPLAIKSALSLAEIMSDRHVPVLEELDVAAHGHARVPAQRQMTGEMYHLVGRRGRPLNLCA